MYFFIRLLVCCCAVGCGAVATHLRAQSSETAVVEEHALYEGVLRDYVRAGRVNYAALKQDARLARYLGWLATRDLAALSRDERLAYWINTYNAVTLKLIVDAWPVDSIMKINAGKPWDLPLFSRAGGGAPLTLNQIEHEIIRKEFGEPRIHFALVCAALSCPPLLAEPYVAARLDEQLTAQTRAFLRDPTANRYDPATHAYVLSPLFQWYAADFGDSEAEVLGFVHRHVTRAELTPVAAGQPVRTGTVNKGAPALRYTDYDWALNAR